MTTIFHSSLHHLISIVGYISSVKWRDLNALTFDALHNSDRDMLLHNVTSLAGSTPTAPPSAIGVLPCMLRERDLTRVIHTPYILCMISLH